MIKTILPLTLAASAIIYSGHSDAGQWRNNGNETNIGGLSTFVYEPTSAPASGDKRALMVSLHGCAQPNDDFKQGAGWAPVADEYGMVIALPQASGEGSYGWMGCWNFHTGTSASRTSSDQKYLLDMVAALLADTSLNIDPDQVYLTGLSSGAGITNQMGCLAPDIFAGVGVNAGPAPGSTGSSSDLNYPSISVSQGKANCENYANKQGYNNQSHLYDQIYNTVHGTTDGTVAPEHAHRNADIAVAVYNADTGISQCETGTIPGASSGNHGDLTVWCDATGPRVSKIMVNGMGHAWPAGNNSTGGGSYIDHAHINYPQWITAWFFANNRRASGVVTPPVGENSLLLTGDNPLTLANCQTFVEPGYTATDKTNGDITNSVLVSGNSFDSCVAGNYSISYSVDYSDGSSDSKTRTVVVEAAIPPSTCQQFTSSNYNHTMAGRAYVSFGYTYALGSGDYLGLWNIYTTTTLAETSDGYFVKGNCP